MLIQLASVLRLFQEQQVNADNPHATVVSPKPANIATSFFTQEENTESASINPEPAFQVVGVENGGYFIVARYTPDKSKVKKKYL